MRALRTAETRLRDHDPGTLPEASVLPFVQLDGDAAHCVAGGALLSVTSDLDLIEEEWRAFEQRADCTPFQTFAWLSTWQRCIGLPAGVMPAIVTGRRLTGELLFLLPLAIEPGKFLNRLTFLGQALCDYNAPLIAPDFQDHVSTADFAAIWTAARKLLQRTAGCRYNLIFLDKMPERIGEQCNPMAALATMLNPNAAYMTALGENWDKFYAEKRSSATRQRDRSKRKKLAATGELVMVSPNTPGEMWGTLGVLFGQKSRWFARRGVPDLFARAGHTEFFLSVAAAAREFVHVSRLDAGATCIAANFGLVFRDCYFHILASYDDGALTRFGPGAAHLHELMRYAIAQGCERYDFTIGDESYKLDWADTKVDLFDHVSGAGWLGRLVALAVTVGVRAKRRIKASPELWRAASRLRALLVSGKQRQRGSTSSAGSSTGTKAAA